MSYSYEDEHEDDDPTAELEILPAYMAATVADDFATGSDADTPPVKAANQPFGSEQLGSELREANDRINELSSELRSRAEMMQSIQVELERLKGFSVFLEKEVEAGKGIIADVTDELISVRTEQNDVGEQLRRREQQIDVLKDKLAQKDAFIDEFARQLDTGNRDATRKGRRPKKRKNGAAKSAVEASPAASLHDGRRTQQKRLRMLVAANDNERVHYPILPGGMTLGTSPESDVRLEDGFVSYRHARITETAAGCVLKDLGSSNGTWINRRRIKWQVLRDGDRIAIGPVRFEFIDRPVEVEDMRPAPETE